MGLRPEELRERQLPAAIEALKQGILSIPVPLGSKGATEKEWQNLRLDEAGLRTRFGTGDPQNRSRLLGATSGGLVDCDLDCMEAVRLAEDFLPSTDQIHGRKSKPRSHYWFRASEQAFETDKFTDEEGEMLLELRGDGHATVVPTSLHESGEEVVWESTGEITAYPAAQLIEAGGRLAAAVLVLRNYPRQGSRHGFALALAGYLSDGGLTEGDAEHFVRAVAEAAGDEEAAARVANVRSTWERRRNGEAIKGRGEFKKLLGENADRTLSRPCPHRRSTGSKLCWKPPPRSREKQSRIGSETKTSWIGSPRSHERMSVCSRVSVSG